MTLGHPDLQLPKLYFFLERRFAAIKEIQKNAIYDWTGLLKQLALLYFTFAFSLSNLSVLFLRYQKLWKSYVKLRHLLANSPKVKQTDKQKLAQREVGIELCSSVLNDDALWVYFKIVAWC